MERKIILGLVGKGRWGQNYINTIGKMHSCELPSENIKTRDYPDLLNKNNVDGIIIASPTNTHFQIAKEFLTNGFNLLIEKPITKTYEEAIALQKLQERTRAMIMAGHIQIYDPGYERLKNSLARIGKLQKMEFDGLQSPIKEDSTVIENWGPHPIYMFMDIANGAPASVSAKKTTNDNIRLEFSFANQLSGVANIGCISTEKKRRFLVTGDRGTLTLDWSGQTKKLYFKSNQGKEEDVSFNTTRSPLEIEIQEFVEHIVSGKESKTPLSQGVKVMQIIQEAQSLIKNEG